MTGQSSPHDAVFRRVLGEPTDAASQLQAVLPTGLTDQLDLTNLTRVPGSFVDANLRWRHIENVGETPTDELHDLFAKLGPEAEEAYMTTAEMLRAEGRAEALVQLLTHRFGPLPPAASERVRTAPIDQLATLDHPRPHRRLRDPEGNEFCLQ